MSGFEVIVPAILTAASAATRIRSNNAVAEVRTEQVASQNQIIEADRQRQASERRDLLARQQATQRARLASWGVGGGDGGSSDAILQGLSTDTSTDLDEIDRSAALKASRNRTNLLDNDPSSANILTATNAGYRVFDSFYD